MTIVAFQPLDEAPRTARWIAVAALLLYVVSGGGRIVGSDEVTMLELSRALLHGGVAVPAGATLDGADGRHYTKNAAAQAVLALPLTAVAEGAAGAAGLAPARRLLAVRFVVSFFNALVTALLLAAFYVAARRLRVRPGIALGATALLGFATPLWVYSKSFMAEPLQGLGLLLALAGCAGVGDDESAGATARRFPDRSARAAGIGMFLAVSAKLSMLPLALAIGAVLPGRRPAAWRAPVVGVLLALAGHGLYDFVRFGTPFETGYGAQATTAAYTTPLWVGLYGLLLSSGKGVLWFAPALWLALPVWLTHAGASELLPPSRDAEVRVRRGLASRLSRLDAEARVRWGAALAWLAALWLYGRFQHWAGDGSFGPRYLVPVLPLAFLVVALVLERGSRGARRWAIVLGVLGLLVNLGGVAIYFGAQMREAGDYPYQLPLEHPRSLSDSHFNPRYTPIVGHWSMLVRNLGEHLHGREPRLGVGVAASAPESTAASAPESSAATTAARLGIAADDQSKLLHALDFWWLYLGYAGFPRLPVWALAGVLKLAGLVAAWRAWRSARAEAPA